jgi:hypothetical protein
MRPSTYRRYSGCPFFRFALYSSYKNGSNTVTNRQFPCA